MSIVLDYVATTNSLTISDNGTIINVAGTGIDNSFSVPQTFQAGITASGSTSLQAVSGTTGTFTGAVSVSGFSNAGSTSLQAVSGTTGTFTGAVSVSGFSNAGSTSLQAGILQSGSAGTGNQSPLLNVGDAFSDFIADGMQWAIPSSASLTTDMPSGTAYLNSVRTLAPAVSGYSFPASNDTYVSINNSGLIDYQSVANGATAPTPTSGYVQTSKIVTSPIQSPTATLSTSTSGSLASGTYGIALVAFDATGYGAVGASGTVAVTSAQSGSGSIEISWVNPLNETSMDIYATIAGSTTLGLVASGVTGTTYTYTGSVAPGAAAPTVATSNAVQSVDYFVPVGKPLQAPYIARFGGVEGAGNDAGSAFLTGLSQNSKITLGGGDFYLYYSLQLPEKNIEIDLAGGNLILMGQANIMLPDPINGFNTIKFKNGTIQCGSTGTQAHLIYGTAAQQDIGAVLQLEAVTFTSQGNNQYYIGGNLSNSSVSESFMILNSSAAGGGIDYKANTASASVDGLFVGVVSGFPSAVMNSINIDGTANSFGVQGLTISRLVSLGANTAININGSTDVINISDSVLDFCQTPIVANGSSGSFSSFLQLSNTYLGNNSSANSSISGNGLANLTANNLTVGNYNSSNTSYVVDTNNLGGDTFQTFVGVVTTGAAVSGLTTSPEVNSVGVVINGVPTPNVISCTQSYTKYTPLEVSLYQTGGVVFALDTSTAANTITLSYALNPAINNGTVLRFAAANNNTGAVTVSVNGTSYPLDGSGGALRGGEIITPYCYEMICVESTFFLVGQAYGAKNTTALIATNGSNFSAPTSGGGTIFMPLQGNGKQVILTFGAYENDTTTSQTIDFPTAFGVTPLILGNNTGLTLTASTTGVTITAPDSTTAYSGTAVIMGN